MIYLEVHEDVYNFYQDLGYIINKKIKILNLEKKVDYSKISQAASIYVLPQTKTTSAPLFQAALATA